MTASAEITLCPICDGQIQSTCEIWRFDVRLSPDGAHVTDDGGDPIESEVMRVYCSNGHTQDDMVAKIQEQSLVPCTSKLDSPSDSNGMGSEGYSPWAIVEDGCECARCERERTKAVACIERSEPRAILPGMECARCGRSSMDLRLVEMPDSMRPVLRLCILCWGDTSLFLRSRPRARR